VSEICEPDTALQYGLGDPHADESLLTHVRNSTNDNVMQGLPFSRVRSIPQYYCSAITLHAASLAVVGLAAC
jgi:hypothetical protein